MAQVTHSASDTQPDALVYGLESQHWVQRQADNWDSLTGLVRELQVQ